MLCRNWRECSTGSTKIALLVHTTERWRKNEFGYAGRVAQWTDTLYRPEHLKKAGMNGEHCVRANYEPLVQKKRHQTAKQEFCLAVFILCGKIDAHFRGKERKGTNKPPPRVGEEVI